MAETNHYKVYFESEQGFTDFQEIEAETEQTAREKSANLDIHDGEIERVELAYTVDEEHLEEVENISI